MTIRKWLFAGLLVLLSLPLSACATTTAATTDEGLDYDDFDFIGAFYQIWNRTAPGGDYLVYLYSTDDLACDRLKEDILAFADAYSDHPVYFFDVTGMNTSTASFQEEFRDKTGITSVPYPALFLIKDQSFDKTKVSQYYYSGSAAIRAILYDLENGTFAFG